MGPKLLAFIALAGVLLIPTRAWSADALSLSFGPTIDGTVGAQKVLTLAYEKDFGAPSLALEAGGWNNVSGGFNGYAGFNFGVHVDTESGLSVRIGFGPCAISGTDERLSTWWQFHIQARISARMGGYEAGAQVDHWSNAGTGGANLGRDAPALFVGIPL